MKQVSVTLSVPDQIVKLIEKDIKLKGFSRSDWVRGAIYDKLHAQKLLPITPSDR